MFKRLISELNIVLKSCEKTVLKSEARFSCLATIFYEHPSIDFEDRCWSKNMSSHFKYFEYTIALLNLLSAY